MTGTNRLTDPAVDDAAAVEHFAEVWEGAWNDHDPDAVAALCAEDLVFDDPLFGDTIHGREAIRSLVTRIVRNYPDYQFTPQGTYANVSRRAVIVAWHFRGTLSGSNQVVEYHGDDRLEIGEDGLVHAYRCIYDNQNLLNQVRAARS
ncbi:MAG: nuclear transport factor 2 family protein [Mycobacterium sp.]